MKNYGSTPAYDVTSWNEFKRYPNPFLQKFPASEFEPHAQVLDPGNSFTVHANDDIDVTDEILKSINDDASRFYLFGQVRYRDAFGRKRITSYRFHYVPRLKRMAFSHEGNSAT